MLFRASIILEGVSCMGKSSALHAFLASPAWQGRAGLSGLVLTEHHTLRPLEALPQPAPADYLAALHRTADYLHALAGAQARTDWDARGRTGHRLSVVLERFHLSALLTCPALTWEEVAPLDAALAELGFGLCLLTASEDTFRRRLNGAGRNAAWQAHAARTLGASAEAQAEALVGQQAHLLAWAARSQMPLRVVQAGGLSAAEVAALVSTANLPCSLAESGR